MRSIASCVLFSIMAVVHRPFEAHLFGVTQPELQHPHANNLPYIGSTPSQQKADIVSRASSFSDIEIGFENPVGLGIFAEKLRFNSMTYPSPPQLHPALLLPLRPPQPMPIDSAWRAIHPPLHTFRNVSAPVKGDTIRAVPPSPAPPSMAYRRLDRAGASSSSRSSRSSSSTKSAVPRSPLSTMTRAGELEDAPILPELTRLSRLLLPYALEGDITMVRLGSLRNGPRHDTSLEPPPLVIRKKRLNGGVKWREYDSGASMRRVQSMGY